MAETCPPDTDMLHKGQTEWQQMGNKKQDKKPLRNRVF